MKKLLVLVLSLCVVSFAFANVDKAAVKDALAAHNAGLDLTKAQDATLFEFYGTGNGSGNVIDNFGGPDAGGYSWLDSEEAGGPTFNWFDITGTGTSFIADMGDDTQNGPYPIGFPFMFYGTAFTDVYICSNGALNFDNNYISLGNVELPNLTHGAQIAIFNDDLDPVGGAADAYYETLNDGTQNVFVISCINWYEYPDGGFAITMQYQLYEDGTIQLHYQTVDAGFDIAGGTIGIQDPTRTIGLTVLYNGSIADYPYDGLAIEFANDGPAPDASLSGYVYDDMSNPLEGATVTLNGNGTLSGIDGFYEFPSLFSGIYPYEVSMGGFITETGNLDIAVGANTADFYLVPMEMDADVLIVDVDATPDSGPVIEGILNDLGYTTYYTNDFYGAPFGDYDYVFVFSGIYPNDFDIATGSPEEAACMDYLNAGGNFYLEGGDNFGFTPPTGLLAMLNIDGQADGGSDLLNVNGEGDLAGLDMLYLGENNWIDHIGPLNGAVQILNNPADGAGCGIVDNSMPWHSAGFSFELGMLEDAEWTKVDIVTYIMDVFNYEAPIDLVTFELLPTTPLVVAPGETIGYDVHLASLVDNYMCGLHYETFVTFLGGFVFGPIDDIPFTMYPFMDHVYTGFANTVPMGAPAGVYTFEGVASSYYVPSLFKSDSFDFEVTGPPPEDDWMEDFEDGLAQDMDWFYGDMGSMVIEDGFAKVDVVAETDEWGSGVYTAENWTDFTASSTHELVVTGGYSVGMLWRGTGVMDAAYSGYAVYCSNGSYSAWVYTAGVATNLVGWTDGGGFINFGVGAINDISIVATADNFDLYSNGNYVGSWTDATYASGYVGVVTAYTNETWFDYVGCSLPVAGANMGVELGELETVLRDDMGRVITNPADFYTPGRAFDRSEEILAEMMPQNWSGSGSFITEEETSVVGLPTEFAMGTAYPNPFNPTASVAIALPSASDLTVTVFNVMGQQVAELANGQFNAGQHSFVFNGSNLSSGLYFIQAQVPGQLNAVQKVTLMK